MHNIKLDEVDETKESKTFNTKKKRMFKLELTDGHNTIYAMEYLIVPSLNTKISPGCKLQIIGPLQVVNHILMLEPRNLKILGGDVDDLLIVNAYENVLLRALNKPTTDTPIRDYNDEVPNDNTQRVSNNVQRPMQPAANPFNRLPQTEENFLDGINFDDDEVDMEMLIRIEEAERMERLKQRNKQNHNPPTVVLQDEDDDAFLASIDFESIDNVANQRARETMEIIEIPDVRQQRIVRANDLPIPTIEIPDDDESDVSKLFIKSAHNSKDPIPKKIARIEPTRMLSISDDYYKFKSHDGDNMLTLDQYLSLTTADKIKKSYVIWGSLEPVMSTLKIKNNLWQLSCDVTDSYSHQLLALKLHNNLLEQLSGVSGLEMKLKYKEVKQRPQLKEDILKV